MRNDLLEIIGPIRAPTMIDAQSPKETVLNIAPIYIIEGKV